MKALQLILTIGFMTAIAPTAKADDYASLLEASSTNPVDATWLITNPSFETGDMQGWTRNPDITDDIEFGGMDRISKNYEYYTREVEKKGLGFEIYIPSRTAIVFKRVE